MASAVVSCTISTIPAPAGAQHETRHLRRSEPSMSVKPSTCTLKLPRTQLASPMVGQLRKRWQDSLSTSRRCSRNHGTRAALGSETPSLETVASEEGFNKGMAAAGDGVHVICWVASWCRKCIYLKPKLAKLLTEFEGVPAMFVDVNEVPGAVVKKGAIKKLPTVQIWRGDSIQRTIIGGQKGSVVVEELKEALNEVIAETK
mmetsp:Transcript_19959/g.43680  ORF Transcript_19959/g.43680 Transcript_19959/m.43680 type:complete len:202 (-) Transcript_19959:57-662(-)